MDAMQGGCGYVEWHDLPLPKFYSELIGDPRDEVWRLRGGGNVSSRFEDQVEEMTWFLTCKIS